MFLGRALWQMNLILVKIAISVVHGAKLSSLQKYVVLKVYNINNTVQRAELISSIWQIHSREYDKQETIFNRHHIEQNF